MRFNDIDELVTDTVNGMFCGVESKKKHQETLFKMVAAACKSYVNNKEFKREIDNYIEYIIKKNNK